MERNIKINEAVSRMKKLKIHETPINEFISEGKLNKSEHSWGILTWLTDDEMQNVRDFENKYNSVVYHVIKDLTEVGTLYTYLYVSDHEDEWNRENAELEHNRIKHVFAYVYNQSIPEFSEFGTVAIEPANGGIVRLG